MAAKKKSSSTATRSRRKKSATTMRMMARGQPPPFVVARGEDPFKVLDESLKYAGFFELLEDLLARSGKRREMFEIVAKVDLMGGHRTEEQPVSFVDPRLVAHLFNQLLDRGFRLLRVAETRDESPRYLLKRDVASVGRALGYDESCYELKDLGHDLTPLDYGALGRRAAGLLWTSADCRLVIAKNRTDELFGPALLLYNVWRTLPTPTDMVALEQGLEPGPFVLQALEQTPVHFGIIDAVHSRDGAPGDGPLYELLAADGGDAAGEAAVLKTDTILAGRDLWAVESAGQRMQGQEPLEDPLFFRPLRKATGYKPPAEIEDLPLHAGWEAIGTRLRQVLDLDRPGDVSRVSLLQRLSQADSKLFPPLAGGFQRLRLERQVEEFLAEARKRLSGAEAAADRSS